MFPVGDPRRGNFVPDCDLTNVLANGECGVVSDTNFGQPTRSTTSDPGHDAGWGNRPYQWEFSAAVDHAAGAARLRVGVGYFRRSFGNFIVDRQPRAGRDRLQPVHGHGAARSAAARRRRLHDRAVPRSQSGHADASRRQPRPAGERLRGPDAGLERHRPVGQRAHGVRRDDERRREHRPHVDRQLRDPRAGPRGRPPRRAVLPAAHRISSPT